MMVDFHDTAQRTGEALEAAAAAEARSIGGGPPRVDRLLQRPQPEGPRLVWIGYSTCSDRMGVLPSGSGAPFATPPPEPAAGGRDRHPRDPLTYTTHHTRAAQRAAAAAKRKEHQGPPRLTKHGRI
jgi:hypothetical protein